jgi:hypothetical protein
LWRSSRHLPPHPPEESELVSEDIVIRKANVLGGRKRQLIAARVRKGKLPPEYLEIAGSRTHPANANDIDTGI